MPLSPNPQLPWPQRRPAPAQAPVTLPRSSHDQAQGPEAGVCDLLSGLLGEEARSKRTEADGGAGVSHCLYLEARGPGAAGAERVGCLQARSSEVASAVSSNLTWCCRKPQGLTPEVPETTPPIIPLPHWVLSCPGRLLKHPRPTPMGKAGWYLVRIPGNPAPLPFTNHRKHSCSCRRPFASSHPQKSFN